MIFDDFRENAKIQNLMIFNVFSIEILKVLKNYNISNFDDFSIEIFEIFDFFQNFNRKIIENHQKLKIFKTFKMSPIEKSSK